MNGLPADWGPPADPTLLDCRAPAKQVNGRRYVANEIKLLAISAHSQACDRNAGGPFGADAGTLEYLMGMGPKRPGEEKTCVKPYWSRAPY